MNSVPVKHTVDTKDNRYYCYDGLYYDNNHVEFTDDTEDNHVEFTDDYDDDIKVSYEDIIGIRIGDVYNVI